MEICVDRSERLSGLAPGMLRLLEHAEVKLLRGLARKVLLLIMRSLCKQRALDKLRMRLDVKGRGNQAMRARRGSRAQIRGAWHLIRRLRRHHPIALGAHHGR